MQHKFEQKPKIYDENRLYQYGLFMLSRRDYARYELLQKMQKWQPDIPTIEKVLDKLQTSGYLSDKRKAKSMLAQYGHKESYKKTIQRMKQKGIDSDTIAEIVDEIEDDSLSISFTLLVKKFKNYDQESYQKYVRFLASKGFSYDVIKSCILQFKN